MKKFIRQFDLFGKPIQLSFDKKGDQHQTAMGGILSILMMIILGFKIYQYSQEIVQRSNDSYTYFQVPIDPQDLGEVQMNQTGTLFIVEIGTNKFLTYQEVQKNIQVYYLQNNEDGSKQITKGRLCVQEDFGSDQKSINAFDKLQKNENRFKFCPENQNFLINYKRGLQVHLARCSNSTNDTCYPKEVINANIADLSIQLTVLTKKMNFLEYDGEPVFKLTQKVFQYFYGEMASPSSQYYVESTIRSNTIQTLDDYLPISNEFTYFSQFFDHSSSKSKIFIYDDGGLLIWGVVLDSSQVQNYRVCYSILNIISDSGGFVGSIQILFAFFIKPFTEHSFFVRFIKRLYYIKTKDQNLYQIKKKKKNQLSQNQNDFNNNNKTNSKQKLILNLNFSNSILLFLIQILNQFFCCVFLRNYKKVKKLYNIGNQKIEKDTDLAKIIKKLKKSQAYKNNFQTPKDQSEVMINSQNEIDLDSSDQNLENMDKNNDSKINNSMLMFPENLILQEYENEQNSFQKDQDHPQIKKSRLIANNLNTEKEDQNSQKQTLQMQSFNELIDT